jgi:orotidine-5'-phosphate decarboxylase
MQAIAAKEIQRMTDRTARERLIVALDLPTVAEARTLVDKLGSSIVFYKIGLELVMSGGLELARQLKAEGKSVFLDMKLLDIPNTVERSVANAAALGVDLLTIHGHDTKTLRAAVAGRQGTGLKLLAVTVLTSIDAADLAEQGLSSAPAEAVLRRAGLARAAGCDGIVASGQEAASVRHAIGPDMLLVTPGIRLSDGDRGDQARITTPRSAIADGASHLVVGRPITAAADPRAAAEGFVREIEIGLSG